MLKIKLNPYISFFHFLLSLSRVKFTTPYFFLLDFFIDVLLNTLRNFTNSYSMIFTSDNILKLYPHPKIKKKIFTNFFTVQCTKIYQPLIETKKFLIKTNSIQQKNKVSK